MSHSIETTINKSREIDSMRENLLRNQYKLQQFRDSRQREPITSTPTPAGLPLPSLLVRALLSLLLFVTILFLDNGKIENAETGSKKIFELISADYTIIIQDWLKDNIYYRPIR